MCAAACAEGGRRLQSCHGDCGVCGPLEVVGEFRAALIWMTSRLTDIEEALEILRTRRVAPIRLVLEDGPSSVLLEADHPAALEVANTAVRDDPTAAQAHAAVGAAYLKVGEFQRGFVAFERGLQLAPDFVELQAGHGATLSSLGRHSEAVVAYDTLLKADPDYFSRNMNDPWKYLIRLIVAEPA